MPELIPVLNKNEIEGMVARVARRISSDYRDRELILIGILKGAFVFLSDLVRHLTIPIKLDFIRVCSYGSDVASSGNIRLTKEIEIDVSHKDVLIVEDIVDTGLTLSFIIDYLKSFNPKTVKICALIDKHERRNKDVNIDYTCHAVTEGFLVGYGLDYNENYRNLAEIYHLKF